MSKWINFEDNGRSPSGKTRYWGVRAKDGGITLGEIYWFAAWRKYVFAPEGASVFEEDCLRDIANFCEEQTKVHGTARKAARARRFSDNIPPVQLGEAKQYYKLEVV